MSDVTPPPEVQPSPSVPVALFPWWGFLIPWLSLWAIELPLVVRAWGFALSKYGALGYLAHLGFYVGLAVGGAILGFLLRPLIAAVFHRRSKRALSDWLTESAALIAWGGGLGAMVLWSTIAGQPNPRLLLSVSITLAGLALGGLGYVLLRMLAKRAGSTLAALTCMGIAWGGSVAVLQVRSQGPSPGSINQLIITIDACNLSHVSTYGYHLDTTPNLTRLAQDNGLKFNQAYTHIALTGPSHSSLFTGLQPMALGVYDNNQPLPMHFLTMAERWRTWGYFTAGIPGNVVMQERYHMHQGFDRFPQRPAEDGLKSLQWEHTFLWRVTRHIWGRSDTFSNFVNDARTGQHATDQAIEAIDYAGKRPWFMWVHYFDPHAPYLAPEESFLEAPTSTSDRLLSLGSKDGLFRVSHPGLEPMYGECFLKDMGIAPEIASPEEIVDLRKIYDAQLRYTDAQIGRLIDYLKATGQYEHTQIVVTADHGEELFDHGYFGHSFHPYQSEMHVPLIIRGPYMGRGPGETDVPVALTDLAHSLPFADFNPPVLTPMSGRSVWERIEEVEKSKKASPIYMYRLDHSRAIVTPEREKLIYHARPGAADHAVRPWTGPEWEWFDLQSDPLELTNLAAPNDPIASQANEAELNRLRRTLNEQAKTLEGATGYSAINFRSYLELGATGRQAEILKSYGYLSGPGSEKPRDESECLQTPTLTPLAEAWLASRQASDPLEAWFAGIEAARAHSGDLPPREPPAPEEPS